ncbi:hypothetical protein B7Y94_05680 [Candidatus Saccharibacteria bacterium 32-49-12]|nr:MAG: hypothetical protein B7Y94_05680 [Candidatus Saccharibacteria bacterium 32-49-12]
MMVIFGIILGLLILVLLVVIHELGHAIAARRNGVVVEEFGIGFPPRAWSKKLKNGVLFTLNWLPLGGFVKLQGEHDAADQPGDYGAATFWQKTKILLAGVAVNWVAAGFLLTILAWTGLPKILPNQFSVPSDTTVASSPVRILSTADNYPAVTAGIREGDIIQSIDGQAVETVEEFVDMTVAARGETVSVAYERAGDLMTSQVRLRDADSAGVAGPIGILGVIFPAAGQAGLTQLTFLTAIISLTLAVMNALPIPALDGGRWFVTAIFKLLRKPLTKDLEEKIHGTGFMLLIGLIILVTIADVGKLFN